MRSGGRDQHERATARPRIGVRVQAMGSSSQSRPGEVRIGVSGWTYPPWRGRFYPKGLPHNQELAHASSVFPSIEINGTFYCMQRPDTFASLGRGDA